MKLYNYTFIDKKSLETFIADKKIEESKNTLVQVFSGVIELQKIQEVTKNLVELLPQASIIGTTTSGEIQDGKMYEGTITLSFSVFQDTIVKSKLYHFDESFSIQEIKKDLFLENTKAVIVFSDGLETDTERFLKEFHEVNPNIYIVGGQAGDNDKFEKTYVFSEDDSTSHGYVFATLSSDSLILNNDYILNWTSVGREMLVTKCSDNVLYELDGIPILEVYRKYLGDDSINNIQSSMIFPLIIRRENLEIARGPVSIREDKGIMFAGDFTLGDSVRFSFANIGDLTDNLDRHFDSLVKYPSEAIYIYSCTARKSLLGEKLQDELNLLDSLAPSTGFFTYGEFFQSDKMAELLNITTTFMLLSETSKQTKKSLKKTVYKEFDPVKKALTHLIKVTTSELEYISGHDTLTSLYNRSEYIKAVERKIKSAQRYGEKFGLILIDLDHFKLVNDNYGHNIGDKVLQAFGDVFRKTIREDDFVGRWGGEEFVVIANHAAPTDLEKLVKKLQKNIAKISVVPSLNITASFGLTVYNTGDTSEKMFMRVDNALYLAKEKGRDCSVLG